MRVEAGPCSVCVLVCPGIRYERSEENKFRVSWTSTPLGLIERRRQRPTLCHVLLLVPNTTTGTAVDTRMLFLFAYDVRAPVLFSSADMVSHFVRQRLRLWL